MIRLLLIASLCIVGGGKLMIPPPHRFVPLAASRLGVPPASSAVV
jgi:hypothetical protein